ncbi:MAG: 3-hydroxyacyl-ACP dehydratase FabZ [Candidatus Sumerlaeota bacterium]|nr:3-hydroxyacyl-ACP dehydratase FabZ [Candidatus Sumerlaeota bacterium]
MIAPEVLAAIPHRPPFLYVDEILEMADKTIVAAKTLDPAEPFFKGHYPDFPLMPGVLVCEAIFQAGAILISKVSAAAKKNGVPVLTRIANAKFKQMVRPGDRLELHAELVDELQNAYYMKGKALVNGKTAVTVEFTCALAPKPE